MGSNAPRERRFAAPEPPLRGPERPPETPMRNPDDHRGPPSLEGSPPRKVHPPEPPLSGRRCPYARSPAGIRGAPEETRRPSRILEAQRQRLSPKVAERRGTMPARSRGNAFELP